MEREGTASTSEFCVGILGDRYLKSLGCGNSVDTELFGGSAHPIIPLKSHKAYAILFICYFGFP